ncbi:LacI family DNA-binding transcriptional regulator [Bordetella sp. N]|uniref:LacI family DNA-binding transcriptional regulator n=1 Tax=Bordetella sp. N TaxID=1746199 RepID=UPI00070ABA4D|nr:LacI family DNA-binding transcriptional regulator [Bordetella sp. N]ALM85908.1 hypothetical protein ASB57_25810 [Bordetella sp. N]
MARGEAVTIKRRASRPKSNAVTARDVARAAGVSVATVSRVLNGNSKVADALREEVSAAAQRLGFTPNAGARALATQRSNSIGAVIPTIENVNFSAGLAALQRRVNQAGYTLLLASSNYDHEEELRQVRALSAYGLAGLMLVGAQRLPQVYELLEAKRIPYVNGWVLDDAHPCVGFDNIAVGSTLADYLLDLGHKDFGIIAQPSGISDRSAGRIAGVRLALASRGLALPQERLIDRTLNLSDGQLALRTLMSSRNPPTAIICGSDTIAFGALVEARKMGIRVPEALSITGINDNEFAAHLTPPLTTIRLPSAEIGERSADYLLSRINGQEIASSTPVEFSLVVRESTAPPPGRPTRLPYPRAARPGR